MADDEIGPEYLTARSVPSSKRGYDKRVINALLSEARDHWQQLQDEYDELKAIVEASGGIEFLGRELSAIATEVGEILSSAQQAADGMRARAREEADRIEHESREVVSSGVAEAESQALDLRRDAWDAGMDLLDSSLLEAKRAISAGKEDVLFIRAQAEKDAHRHLSAAEREASDLIRRARYESDRQLNQAREVAQQIIDRATTPQFAETGSQPMSASDFPHPHREELLAEIERLRLERSIESVEVFSTEPKVRLTDEEPIDEALDPDGIDLSDELAAEIHEMRSEPKTISIRVDSPTQTLGTEDDVGTLFEELRTTEEPEPNVAEEQLPTDPFELRDRLLLPVINGGVSDLKRHIVDMQSVALDGLRRSGWTPAPGDIARDLDLLLESMTHKAGSAGATAAGPLGGLYGSVSEPGDRAGRLTASMSAALASQLTASLEDSRGPEEGASAVSQVFRSWRNDEAERWVRSVATAAYHDSLLAALRLGGISKVVALSTGAPCENCAGPEGLSWRPGREPPNGVAVPPASLGCSCTLATA